MELTNASTWKHGTTRSLVAAILLLAAFEEKALAARGPEVRTSVPCPDGSDPFELHIADAEGGDPSRFPRPWLEIDFVEEPERYLWTVLESALAEGTLPWSRPRWWEEEKDLNRLWYHVPWLDYGDYGRECRNGLTRERSSRPGELHDSQVDRFQNWGVAMYNAVGARTLARVWFGGEPDVPNPAGAQFEQGAVAIKVLFTEAGEDQVPHLREAPVWTVLREVGSGSSKRWEERGLRLVQVDVAAWDDRSPEPFGWVFGSFAYDADRHAVMLKKVAPAALPACLRGETAARDAAQETGGDDDRPEPAAADGAGPEAGRPGSAVVSCRGLVPIGIMWGDDDGNKWKEIDRGKPLGETRILLNRVGVPRYLGWAGRLNGPVDSGLSSCIQCHRISEFPLRYEMTPDPKWLFDAVMPDVPVGGKVQAHRLGMSLQLALGLENYCKAGEEENWVTPWREAARELCAPFREVREEREGKRYLDEALASEAAELSPLARVSREVRIDVLDGLRRREYGAGFWLGVAVGVAFGVLGAVLLGGGAAYTWRGLRRQR